MATFEELAAQYGAEEVEDSSAPDKHSAEFILNEGGVNLEPETEPQEPTFEELAKQYGAVESDENDELDTQEVEPPAQGGLAAFVNGVPAKTEQQTVMENLASNRNSLTTEGINLRDNVPQDHPQRKELEEDFVERWVEQGNMEREEFLANRVTFGGKTDPNFRQRGQALRRLEEISHRFAGTIQATTARVFGDEEKALGITAAMNDLQEYNALLDRHSVLGKKYGPLFGQIASSLGTATTGAVTTGGLSGVAGLFALEDFNNGMEAAKDLTPAEQWQHATMKSAVTFATTQAGGMLASKAGVASGDTIIPMFSKTINGLFTKTGIAKAAVASGIEAGEEGVQALLGAIEDSSSGVNPNATDGLLDTVLGAATTGALVGSVTQATHSAGKLGLKAQHLKDLTEGWLRRLPKKGDTPRAVEQEVGHVVDPQGNTISKSALNQEVEALTLLEKEMDQQFKDGGATELKHVIAERETDIEGLDTDLKALRKERGKLKGGLGRSDEHSSVKNLNQRIKIMEGYKKEVQAKMGEDQTMLKDWDTEFKEVHKQEREYLDSEFKRLAEKRELPDASEKVIEAITKPEPKTKDPTKKDTEKAPEGDVAKDDAGEADTIVKDHPSKGESRGSSAKVFDAMDDAMVRARQVDQSQVRDVLGLDTVAKRESLSTDHAFQQAYDQGLPAKAREISEGVLETGRIMDSVELAGVQARYVDRLNQITLDSKFIEENPGLKDGSFNARKASLDDAIDEVNTLTEAWIQSSSEAGAALQAQQRVFGVVYGLPKALADGRRNKGEDLTKAEIQNLSKAVNDVQKATDDMVGLEHGTDAYDRADFRLAEAMVEHKAAISNLKPKSFIMRNAEAYNAVRMALTLSGDLVPMGRQGFVTQFTNPVQATKNFKAFFKPFLQVKSAKEAEFEAFKIERSLREMENYKVLTEEFGVPKVDRHTEYSAVEAGALSRLEKGFSSVGKVLGKVPMAKQFDLGYRTWLNTTRVTMADIAYRANKDILDSPGGKAEMQAIIENIMNATGHTKGDLGKAGSVAMTAPRWFLSRLAYPAKALKHIPRGLYGKVTGKKNSSTYLAGQYAKAMGGAYLLSGMMEGVTSLMFGAENVSMDRNPASKTAGFLTVNGRQYDLTGGMGFVARAVNKAVAGTAEFASGVPDRNPDADFGQTLGGTLGNRASPFVRDLAFLFQSGKPMGSKEKMALSEYMVRNSTYLTAQEIHDAGKAEGLGQAALSGMMEFFGFSGFEKR